LTPPAAPTITSIVPGTGSFTVSWSRPDGHGAPIASYTLQLSPGKKSCTTSGTHCTITGLQYQQQYSLVVHATNGTGLIGPGSPAVLAYPSATGKLAIWPHPLVQSALTQLRVGVIGGKPGDNATVSIPRAPVLRCRLNVAGQCSFTSYEPLAGDWTVYAVSGGQKATRTLYDVRISTPIQVKLGQAAHVMLTHCPPRSAVLITTDFTGNFSTRASASGSVSVFAPTPKSMTTLSVMVTVAGVNLGTVIVNVG
jgi:hypothetical protein